MRLLMSSLVFIFTISVLSGSSVSFAEDKHESSNESHAKVSEELKDVDDHDHEPAHMDPEDVHDDAHDHGGHHSHVGDPATEPPVLNVDGWRFDLMIYSLTVFVLLLAALSKFAWGPITTALDEREENIRKSIDDAETARVKAEEMLAEHQRQLDGVQEQVREIIAEARRDAEHTKETILAEAEQAAETMKARAEEDINRAKDTALSELFGNMTDRVVSASEKVVGRSFNDDDQRRLIDEALAEFSS